MGKAVPEVKINLDKERTMRLDLNALETFEETAGKELKDFKGSIKDIKAMVWSSLMHEDAELTLDQVGKLVHLGNLDAVTSAIEELMSKND